MLTRARLLFWLIGFASNVVAQTNVVGRVTDAQNRPVPGANVFLRGTFDGASADSSGQFRFTTLRPDTATLVVTAIGFDTYQQRIRLGGSTTLINVRLREAANELNTVVITAGSFDASDERRMTLLKPMDIVTTAGAGADITAVMNLLPGAQRVGEQEGLFVRGGSGQESKVVIDGMIVQNPFFSSLPDIQQRGRFSPFMFKGTSFSTGGYSAQYGQALSSVLLLNTTDKGTNNGLSLGLNLAGANASYDWASERASVSGTINYVNLRPLFALVRQNVDWTRIPDGLGSSLTYRLRPTRNGLLKVYGMYNGSRVGLYVSDPTSESGRMRLEQGNRYAFGTATYTDQWDEGRWLLNAGASYSHNVDATTFDGQDFGRADQRAQARVVLTRLLPGNSTVLVGAEAHHLALRSNVVNTTYRLSDNYAAAFAESEVYVSRRLAVRAGIRAEYNALIDRANGAPRLSMAYKTGAYSQVSVAAGQFYQMPDYRYFYQNRNLRHERADHLILNYQRIRHGRTFRVETFYKNYAALVREFTGEAFDANPFRFPWGHTRNTGSGYAQGFDLFWRDQKTVKGLDYWLTYSYVDTKRLFLNYVVAATPTFVSNHNLSLVAKRNFPKLRTNVGLTYAFTSGRPYYNPNRPESQFLTDRTPAVHNVSVVASHFTTVARNFLVLYATVDNLLNTRNVFTYRFTPDGTTRYAVGPPAYRSFFVGAVLMLSKKATVNQTEF